jgi:hypothetical protein
MKDELKNIMGCAAFIATTMGADEQDYKNLKKRIVALDLPQKEFERAVKQLSEVLSL